MNLLFTEQHVDQLDRREGLNAYLRREPSSIVLPTRQEYVAMSASERQSFNMRRLDHLSSDLIVATHQVGSVVKHVQQGLLLNRMRTSGRLGVMVTGHPGMGKTTAVVAAMRTIYSNYRAQFPDFEARGEIPVVYIEIPPGATGKSVVARFADFLGLPVPPRSTLEDLTRVVVPQLLAARTRLIVVDEIHNLSSTNRANLESRNVLKSLSDMLPVTFVYAGFNIRNGGLLSGQEGQQIAGRFSLIELERFTLANDAERDIWNATIRAFELQLGLFNHAPGTLAPLSSYLHRESQGSIGTLGRLLTNAAQLIVYRNGAPEHETITESDLESIPRDHAAVARQGAITEGPTRARRRTSAA